MNKELGIRLGRDREVDRCKNDPTYFMSTYWTIKTMADDAKKGAPSLRPFKLRPFQHDFIDTARSKHRIVILKGRQIGFTKVVSAYLGWYAMSHPHSDIFYVSKSGDDAAAVIEEIRIIGMAGMPAWMFDAGRFPTITNKAASPVKFSNGSSIDISAAQRGNPVRSRTSPLVVLDEFSYYLDQQAVLNSVEPAVDNGATLIVASTSTGYDSIFSQLWLEADAKQTAYTAKFYGWQSVPTRDQKWYAREFSRATTPKARAEIAREHPNDPEDAFTNVGRNVFDLDLIKTQLPAIRDTAPKVGFLSNDKNDIEFLYDDSGPLTVYKDPLETNHMTVIGADVCFGLEHGDYSCAVVINTQYEVCAIWHGQCDAKQFAIALDNLGRWYGYPLLAVEHAGPGQAALSELLNLGYRNLYRRERTNLTPGAGVLPSLGWETTRTSKPRAIEQVVIKLNEGLLILNDEQLAREMMGFVRVGKANVMQGSPHDDRVMALAIATTILKYANDPLVTHDASMVKWSLEWFEMKQDMAIPPVVAQGGRRWLQGIQ